QPPKRKSTGKKPAKARTPTLIDGLTKEEMSKEQVRLQRLVFMVNRGCWTWTLSGSDMPTLHMHTVYFCISAGRAHCAPSRRAGSREGGEKLLSAGEG
uniref:Uncharacterized protein n=1 Tax=Stegastes partitus TaxID=144197 RepID=A0A3B4Z1G1_9TELE